MKYIVSVPGSANPSASLGSYFCAGPYDGLDLLATFSTRESAAFDGFLPLFRATDWLFFLEVEDLDRLEAGFFLMAFPDLSGFMAIFFAGFLATFFVGFLATFGVGFLATFVAFVELLPATRFFFASSAFFAFVDATVFFRSIAFAAPALFLSSAGLVFV